MSDLVVREACKHGRYDKHVVWQSEAYAHPCPGGREIVLREIAHTDRLKLPYPPEFTVYVLVEEA